MLLRRILAGTGANGYAQIATIAIQLGSLPLFLAHWDLDTYGRWLVLTAIPSYLTLADVGMVTAAGNRMTMLMERDAAQASRVFQSATVFLLGISAIALVLVAAALVLAPASWMPSDGRLAVALLAVGVLVAILGGLPEAALRATGRYALGTSIATHVRLLEWAGGMVALAMWGSFAAIAAGMLLPRLLGTLALAAYARRSTSGLQWGVGRATRAEIRSLLAPALYFMAFPMGNALAFQGFTLLVAGILGPAAAAIFNTYRTLARVTVQATSIFSHALWPELSRMHGSKDRAALSRVYRKSFHLGIGISLAAGIGVFAVSPLVLLHWSHGRIAFDPVLMALAMSCAAAAGFWHVPRVLLLSTNRHRAIALQFLGLTFASLPLAAGLMSTTRTIDAAFLAMLATELVLMWLCVRGAAALIAFPAGKPTEATT